jgi:hypothetical protein
MTRHAIIAIAMAAVGVVGLGATLLTHGSVRDHIAKRYRFVADEAAPGGSSTRTRVYASNKLVGATTRDIASKFKPADRRVTEAGTFLRYRDDVVSIVPAPRGQRGSRVLVDDEAGGYHRNYPYVGGFWGTYSGPAGSFRDGGPGAGK